MKYNEKTEIMLENSGKTLKIMKNNEDSNEKQ